MEKTNIAKEHYQFIDYRIEEIKYAYNFENADIDNFTLTPQFVCNVQKTPAELFVSITAEIANGEKEKTPFDVKVTIVGRFSYEPEIEKDMSLFYHASISILYPYLRSVLTSTITSSNMPAYFLPTIDPHKFVELLKKAED